ncbi:MAG: putative DNA binding domain-containing protein [Fimbriimonas sp.]|nr:putative DNA binding domain-containing protein [Fimbriimonas sp.]
MTNITEELIKGGEGERVEFKASLENSNVLARVVCSFLNATGGVLVIGVDDGGKPNGEVHDGDDKVLERHLRSVISPAAPFTVSFESIHGHGVLTVDVPSGTEKPYLSESRIFVRVGGMILEAVPDQASQLVTDRLALADRWERRIALGLSLPDLAEVLVKQTISKADDRGFKLTDQGDLESCLRDFALLRSGQFTNACDVLYGRKVAVRQPQTRARAVRFSADRSSGHLDEQLFEGPAPKVLDDLLEFARRHIEVKGDFPANSVERIVKPVVPFAAIREGLVNAVVHREYNSFSGGVALRIFPSRVEIWNSGSFPPNYDIKDLKKPEHPSVLVNPDISLIFYLLGLMERAGRGAYSIIRSCLDSGLSEPRWQSDESGVLLTLGSVPLDLSDEHRSILALSDHGSITVGEVELPERTARRRLKELVDAGYLKTVGEAKARRYVRTEKQI